MNFSLPLAGVAIWLCCLSATTHAADAVTLDELFALTAAPPGVVFEIVSRDPAALSNALPRVRGAVRELQRRYPGLPLAVVSHGREQFALSAANADRHEAIHEQARGLHADGVELQVCGTYAEREGLAVEDFPDYVAVAAEGPAQINDYVSLGYLHVRIRE